MKLKSQITLSLIIILLFCAGFAIGYKPQIIDLPSGIISTNATIITDNFDFFTPALLKKIKQKTGVNLVVTKVANYKEFISEYYRYDYLFIRDTWLTPYILDGLEDLHVNHTIINPDFLFNEYDNFVPLLWSYSVKLNDTEPPLPHISAIEKLNAIQNQTKDVKKPNTINELKNKSYNFILMGLAVSKNSTVNSKFTNSFVQLLTSSKWTQFWCETIPWATTIQLLDDSFLSTYQKSNHLRELDLQKIKWIKSPEETWP